MPILSILFSNPALALTFLLGLVLAVSVHEWAHAATAYHLGDDTPYLDGRVTLNPAAHLDPVGSLLFLLTGIGWGKPVIINPFRLPLKHHELLVALAGPVSNILLALGLNILAAIVPSASLGATLQFVASINIFLAAFNMLPIPPLDGSSIVAYFYPPYRSLAGSQMGVIVLVVFLLIPIGGTSLATALASPFVAAFSQISQLFGIL
jgi:Zn-dependent protease